MSVPDKAAFLRESQAGRLGNYLRIYDKLYQAAASGHYVTIRSRVPQSSHFTPVVEPFRVYGAIGNLFRNGAKVSSLYCQQIPPPDLNRVIQFEARLSERGIDLCYELDTTSPLRGIRDRGTWAFGLEAQAILRTYLSPTSYDDLQAMFELHPTSTVEASEFILPVGEFHRQLLFWEVRDF